MMASWFERLRKRPLPVSPFEETSFRAIVEASPDAMILVDGDGRMMFFNHQAEVLFGYKREEILGRSVEALIPAPLRVKHERFRAAYAAAPRVRAMGSGVALSGVRKDGIQVPVEVSLSPLKIGQETLVLANVRDISDRKLLEDERHGFFKLALDLLCILTVEGRFKRHNPAFTSTLGWPSERLLTMQLWELLHPDDEARVRAIWSELARPEQLVGFEARCRTNTGDYRELEWRAVRSQQHGTVYATARDVTEVRGAARLLRERSDLSEAVSREKNALFSRMSEELRAHLIGIMDSVVGLTEGDPRANARSVDRISQISAAARTIVDLLRDLAEMEAGHMVLDAGPFSVRECVAHSVARLEPGAPAPQLRIAPEIPNTVVGDRERLAQVITGLLSQTRRATAAEPATLEVMVRRADDRTLTLRFLVAGIEQHGTDQVPIDIRAGYGRALTRRLVELMGGQLEYDGAVAAFSCSFERHSEPPAAPRSGASHNSWHAGAVSQSDTPHARASGEARELVVFDRRALSAELQHDEALLHELSRVFRDDSAKFVRELEQAVAGQQHRRAEKLAHSLKGAAATLRAPRAAAAAAELESAARAGQDLAEPVRALELALAELMAVLPESGAID